MIVAFDLGTKCGCAWKLKTGLIGVTTFDLAPRRFDGGGMRFVRFTEKLNELHHAEPFERVYFEEVRAHLGVDAAHVYGGLLATLTAFCEGLSIPYEGVPVGGIKKHATGKGNASKEAVMAAMLERGYCPFNFDEADALALLDYKTSEQR